MSQTTRPKASMQMVRKRISPELRSLLLAATGVALLRNFSRAFNVASSSSLPHRGVPTSVPPSVVLENIKSHEEAIRESEELFYGYFGSPDGITDWQSGPTGWRGYCVAPNDEAKAIDDNHDDLPANLSILRDRLSEIHKRVVPHPFDLEDLCRVSHDPILSKEECAEIIAEADSYYWGWGSSDERYGTPPDRIGHMLPLERLSRSYTLVNFELLPRLFPAILDAFPSLKDVGTSPETLRLGGCRVVKYDASEGRVELGMHRDGLLITANIALNPPSEYIGGGTIVEGATADDEPIRLHLGHVLLHPGDVLHGGSPILEGKRYVLVLFIFATNFVPHEKYCQDRMERDVEAARSATCEADRERLFATAKQHYLNALAFMENRKDIAARL